MDDFEILIPVALAPAILEGLSRLGPTHELWLAPDREAKLAEVAPRIRAIASGFAPGRIDAALISRLPKLEIIAHLGVGYDLVDAKFAGERGVIVTNTPDVLNDEVADYAMGLLLATISQLPQADRFVREGRWAQGGFPLTTSLRGRTMGVLGLGRIGAAIARRAEAFGLKIIYHGRKAKEGVAYPYFERLEDMARACDIFMVAAPATAETRGLIDVKILKALGPNGVLINIARGALVDEEALIAALRSKTILSAGLDVFANEPYPPRDLVAMEHVVLLPHAATATHETREAMGRLLVGNLASWAAGKGPLTPVRETPWPRPA